ncbi:ABC transporter permease subunit [Polaromonas sp. UBA4122]|uniref:ABC transporter permease subunit n=1 Tax=Polaromonas sp. UBA4122 TaxID=1947074 RepID=UPI0032E4D481
MNITQVALGRHLPPTAPPSGQWTPLPGNGSGMKYSLDFSTLLPYWPAFLNGAWLTLKMTAVAVVVGMGSGTLLAFAKRSKIKPLASVCAAYIEVVRNTPFLVQIFLLYFGLSSVVRTWCHSRAPTNTATLLW